MPFRAPPRAEAEGTNLQGSVHNGDPGGSRGPQNDAWLTTYNLSSLGLNSCVQDKGVGQVVPANGEQSWVLEPAGPMNLRQSEEAGRWQGSEERLGAEEANRRRIHTLSTSIPRPRHWAVGALQALAL